MVFPTVVRRPVIIAGQKQDDSPWTYTWNVRRGQTPHAMWRDSLVQSINGMDRGGRVVVRVWYGLDASISILRFILRRSEILHG